jgi:hypothetical protein
VESPAKARLNYRPRCPNCGSRQVVQIYYGVADMDMLMKAQMGLAILGGDKAPKDAPTHRCNICGHSWN